MPSPSREGPAVDPWLAAYVAAAAETLLLPIRAEHRAGVEHQFARIAAFARRVSEHRFDITDEPAPHFHPGKGA